MGILNKRNAVLGWGVWQFGKAAAKRKAKQSLEPEGKRPGKRATIAGALAAVGGALWFWRRSRGDDEGQ